MERIKVLSAALSLREFTVDELAALSGVKPTTVQSVLTRSPSIVERTGSEGPGRRGRPSTKWAIVNPEAAAEITAGYNLPPSNIKAQPPALSPDNLREIAIRAAEQALAQAADEHDPQRRRHILRSAQASLHVADDDTPTTDEPWWNTDISPLAVRARAADALATLASTPENEVSEELLNTTATAIAAAISVMPERGDALYFAPLAKILAGRGALAPLFLFGAAPPLSLGHWALLEAKVERFGLRTQSWAAPLAGVSCAMPLAVFSSTRYAVDVAITKERLALVLDGCLALSRSAVVIANSERADLARESARHGAPFVPFDWESQADEQLAVQAVASIVERTTAGTHLARIAPTADGRRDLTRQEVAKSTGNQPTIRQAPD